MNVNNPTEISPSGGKCVPACRVGEATQAPLAFTPRDVSHTLFTDCAAKETIYRAACLPGAEERAGFMAAPPALPILTFWAAAPAGAAFFSFFF
jgi:hypothetical protein